MKSLMFLIVLIIPLLIQAQTYDFEITLTDGSTVTVNAGDKIKLAKLVESKPSAKHPVLLGSLYNMNLDNGKFDENSVLSYTEITGNNQDVYLNHTEIRFNFVVSVEWDAKKEYLESVNSAFRQISNLLYDITDGQARLDTVMIYDNQEHWLEADVRIRAHNNSRPIASINGINSFVSNDVMQLPRKWYADIDDSRNGSYDEIPPLNFNSLDNIAIIAHELGHYLLGFNEEYEFMDNNGRCGSVYNYGFMDEPYFSGLITFASATEMSSASIYQDTDCRNTRQYNSYGTSCWEMFEVDYEGNHGTENIFMPIYRPTVSNIDENITPSGLTYMPGPNNDLQNLDYDVGARLVTPIVPTMSAAFDLDVVTLDGQSNRLGNIYVVLRKYNGQTYRDIEQGSTSDVDPLGVTGGGIYVLGAETGDQIMVSSDYTIMGISRRALSSPSSLSTDWYSGIATVGAASDSLQIELKKVEGSFPLIVKAIKDSTQIILDMGFLQQFSELPTAEIVGTGNQYTFSQSGNSSYTVTIPDTLINSGVMTVYAKDANNTDFFFNLNYQDVSFDSASSNIIESNNGLLRIERLDTVSQNIFILSSPYPILENNLLSTSLKISNCFSIWKSTDDSLRLTIRYSDADLHSDDSFIGYEDMLGLYKWDEINFKWDIVPSELDTLNNSVNAKINSSGVFALFSSNVMTTVENRDISFLPTHIYLSQNYPNPFNPTTDISYSLPKNGYVKLEVFNTLGQRVTTLVDSYQTVGNHSVKWDAGETASGIYFYKLILGESTETKKMLLLK